VVLLLLLLTYVHLSQPLKQFTFLANRLASQHSSAGSSWGANANTLRSSVLALCYSVAENWRDLQTIDVTSRCREDWQSATVVNSTLVVDPTI